LLEEEEATTQRRSGAIQGKNKKMMMKMMMGSVQIKPILLLCIVFGLISHSTALITTILAKECVYEEVEYAGDLVSGNFVVREHGFSWGTNERVELVVTSPGGTKVFSAAANDGKKFEFQAHERGLYRFCFINPSSTPETISFYIHVGHVPGIEDLAKDEHLTPVNVKIAKLREALESVSAEQNYLKARDFRHRITNESTNTRLIFYTMGEYLCLVGVSLGQVYLIRQLFSKRLGYNRV